MFFRVVDSLNKANGFFCNLMPLPRKLEESSDANLRRCQYVATLAWVGSKPAKELIEKSMAIFDKTVKGNVSILLKNKDGIVTSGVVDPKQGGPNLEKVGLGPNVKIWFERKNVYLHGVSLANVDLALVISSYLDCDVHTELEPVSDEVN